MRYVLTILFVSTALIACPEDKEPNFPENDAPVSDSQSDSTDRPDVEEDNGTTGCFDHEECLDDELCFEGECVDWDEAIDDCGDDDDCPDGWYCYEEDYCEEE